MKLGTAKSKCETRILSVVITTVVLVACSTSSPSATGNATPTINLTDVNSTSQSAAATLFAQTMAPTLTATAVPTNTPKPTPTPLPFRALEGLRVAYTTSDGNLYVRDSGKPAIQLTSNVANRRPLFSDDGQKIVFYRGENELCVIGADGSGEQTLITLELLSVFGERYNESTGPASLAFIPGTHSLIFNTGSTIGFGALYPHPNKDLVFVDSDTGEIRQLRAPDQGGNFFVSPDGKKIAVQTIDHIDVIDTHGRLLHRNLVTHSPIDDYYGIWWAFVYWKQDSSELIVAATDIPPGVGLPVLYTVRRYPLDGHPSVEVPLNPQPEGYALSISPDGNWIVYGYSLGPLDATTTTGIYLGNLKERTSQLLYTPPVGAVSPLDLPSSYHGWSPDSLHFILEGYNTNLYVGNIYGEFTQVGFSRGTEVFGWIDNSRFLMQDGVLYEVGKQEIVRVVNWLDAFIFLGH